MLLQNQPTGQQATTAVGDLTVGIGVVPTGVSATSSVGSLTVGIGVPLTGVSATSAVGAISPTPMTVGLTGQLATSSVGTGVASSKYYGKLDPKTSTGYTTLKHLKRQLVVTQLRRQKIQQDTQLKLLHNYV